MRSLLLTDRLLLGGRRGGGAPAWTPAELFTAGRLGEFWWPKSPGTVWSDSAKTTPAVANTHTLAAIDGLSGNGHTLTQSDSARRPALKASGGLVFFEQDGIDDFMSANTRMGLAANPAIEIWAAVEILSTPGHDHTILQIGSNEVGILSAGYGNTSQDGFAWRFNVSPVTFGSSPTGKYVLGYTRTEGSNVGASALEVNGSPLSASSNPTALPNSTSESISTIRIRTTPPEVVSHIRYFALLACGFTTSADERAKIREFMAAQAEVTL